VGRAKFLEQGKLRSAPAYALGLVVEPCGDEGDCAAIFRHRSLVREVRVPVSVTGNGALPSVRSSM